MKPLTDKQRAIALTRLGIKNVQGLRDWRERLNIQPPAKPRASKPRKPVQGIQNGSKQVRCIETGQVFPSVRDAAKHFQGTRDYLSKHLRGVHPRFRGHTFEYF